MKKTLISLFLLFSIILSLFFSIPIAFAETNNVGSESTGNKIAVLFSMADYIGDINDLDGPVNDIIGMGAVLQNAGYTVYDYKDCKDYQMLYYIDKVIDTLSPSDTLLVSYSGHGIDGGKLVCADESFVYASELEACMSQHCGEKMVLIDACYSGDFVAKSSDPEQAASAFNSDVISAFTQSESSSKTLNIPGYKVMTACSGDQVSYEMVYDKSASAFATTNYAPHAAGEYWIGAFNEAFHNAAGLYEPVPFSVMYGDANSDGSISLNEMYLYASDRVSEFQDVQVYPQGDTGILYTPTGTGSDGGGDESEPVKLFVDSSGQVIGYAGHPTSLHIPDTIDGTAVTAIDTRAFKYCMSLTDVTMTNNITDIDAYAFLDCENLASITLSTQLDTIGESAFKCCYSLQSVEIPSGTISLGFSAFRECISLESITIPASVFIIGTYALLYCDDDLTIYGDLGSYAQTYARNNAIPFIDPSIDTGTDYQYTNNGNGTCTITLYTGEDKDIIIPNELDGLTVTALASYAFEDLPLTSVVLPDTITSLGVYVFADCEDLVKVNIPAGINEIPEYTFRGCVSLESVSFHDYIELIGQSAFNNCRALTSIVLPANLKTISNYAFNTCVSLTSLEIPEGVTSIGAYAFYGCAEMAELTIPDTVTTIETNAFAYCKKLTEFTIPGSIASLGAYAFWGCEDLVRVSILDGVEAIGMRAFWFCDELVNVGIPSSVTSIGSEVFDNCNFDLTIYAPEGSYALTYANSEGIYCFAGEQSVYNIDYKTGNVCEITGYAGIETNLLIPEVINGRSVTGIRKGAFENKNLEFVTLPDSLIMIGYDAFAHNSLGSVDIPDSVTEIGVRAFMDNVLQEVTLPDGLEKIGMSAFAHNKIESFTIPASVTSFGSAFHTDNRITEVNGQPSDGMYWDLRTLSSYGGESDVIDLSYKPNLTHPLLSYEIGISAFDGCGIDSITLHKDVEEINIRAFANNHLSYVNITKGVKYIRSEAFSDNRFLVKVIVPSNVTFIENDAFAGCSDVLTIYGEADSYVQTYAQENNIPFCVYGDMTDDGVVDLLDIAAVAQEYNMRSAHCDMNNDNFINLYDLVLVAKFI